MRGVDGVGSIATAAVRRFFDADGTSHMRALAYESIFVLLSGFIGLIGLASVLGVRQLRLGVQQMVATMSPGASGKFLQQAASRGASSGGTAALFGLLAAASAGTLAVAQLERSANRLAGAEDRPVVQRFVRAFGLAMSAGLTLAVGGLILAGGQAVASGAGWTDAAASAWAVARWPLGILVAAVAIYALFRAAPRSRIHPRRVILAGVGVAVVLWVVFTAGLALYLSLGGGRTYGSMIAVVALLLWSVLTSLALHLGLAVAYELQSRAEPGSVREADDDRLPTTAVRR
jgi:uncharacterized BrkB/YihY/UPF0761 family membrane protein